MRQASFVAAEARVAARALVASGVATLIDGVVYNGTLVAVGGRRDEALAAHAHAVADLHAAPARAVRFLGAVLGRLRRAPLGSRRARHLAGHPRVCASGDEAPVPWSTADGARRALLRWDAL